MIQIVIDESFINMGIDLPLDCKTVIVREGRMPLIETVDYIIDHYKLFFTDNFLNCCSMGDTFTIEVS